MAYRNTRLRLRIGNVETKVLGLVPAELLDRELNPHLAGPDETRRGRVFHPRRSTALSGALPSLKRLLREAGIRYRICDPRLPVRARHDFAYRGPQLRDYQLEVVEEAIRRGRGILDIGTGGGKTLLAAALVARLGLPALYLVTTRTLLAQAVRHLSSFLDVELGVIGDGTQRPRPVTVALVQSLVRLEVDLAPWRDGVLLFDEGHHACAPTYLDVIRRADARYNFFLSAVPFRAGPDQIVLDALTGGSLTGGRYAARYLIAHGYAAPVRVRLLPCPIRGEMTEKPFPALYREFIVENEARNAQIAAVAAEARAAGRATLVLVEHVEHGMSLATRIGGDVGFVHGGLGRNALRGLVDRFSGGELRVLIATAGLFQEGVSVDGIQALIHAGALKSRAKVIQALGRGMRLAPGKSHVTFVDFFDDDEAGLLRAHSLERLRTLRAEGFYVPPLDGERRPAVDVPPMEPCWTHVPGTNRFLRIAGDGTVAARGRCLRAPLVPPSYCRKCKDPICQRGGLITWLQKPEENA